MSYRAKVVKVMIASPGDVAAERQVVRNVIQEWNFAHSEDKNIVLMPVGWDSHSSPAMGGRPQAIINKQVLADCDLLIAVFWTKFGTPTGKALSGTVEEIEEHIKTRKPAMIYFSSIPVRMDSVDPKQFQAVQDFKAQLRERGLYAEYESIEDFRETLSRQFAQTVIRHFASKKNGDPESVEFVIPSPKVPSLSDSASEMLIEASQDRNGLILKVRTFGGLHIQTNSKNLAEDRGPRNTARWESALRELCDKGLLTDRSHNGGTFAVTDEGYRVADLLKEKLLVAVYRCRSHLSQ